MSIASSLAAPPVLLEPARAQARMAVYRPLGGLRFGLALLVLIQHFGHLLAPAEPAWLAQAGLGAVAVSLFFVISGFVVCEANLVFYAGRPGAFLANRLLRVVPPYLAALALAVAVQALLWWAGLLLVWDFTLSGSPLQPALLVSGVLALVPGFHSQMIAGQAFEFIPFAWTLRVEMAFYAVACLSLLLAQRAGAAALRGVLAGACVLCAAFLTQHRPGLLSSGPMFLAGVALCLLLSRRTALNAIFVGVSLVLTFLGFASYRQHGHPVLAMQFALLAGLLALTVWLLRARAGGALKRWDRALGDLSYPLYLNHYAVGILLYDAVPVRGVDVMLGGAVVSIVLAAGMLRLVERPMRRMRARVRGATL